MIHTSGTTANTDNEGTIHVQPNTRYHVRFEILQNDLHSASEKVTAVWVDGEDLGECNPTGGDYDCTFWDCSPSQKSLIITSKSSGKVEVNMKLTGHSWDCDCDTTTWECSKQDTVSGRTKMTAVGIFILTPVGEAIRQEIYSTHLSTDNKGVMNIVPHTEYQVRFEILKNDLGSARSGARVTDVVVGGKNLGKCNPPSLAPLTVCVRSHLDNLSLRGSPSWEQDAYATREACRAKCASRGALAFAYYKNDNYNGKKYTECRCGASGKDLEYMKANEPVLRKKQVCEADDIDTHDWWTGTGAMAYWERGPVQSVSDVGCQTSVAMSHVGCAESMSQ